MTFAADRGLSRPRVAFALSRHRGTAVARNRVRRRLRAVFREHAIDLAPGRYLVGVRTAASAVTYRRARTDLMRLLGAANALRNQNNGRP